MRLTRKLAEQIDGVDLSTHEVGEILHLPASDAQLLLAEDWAISEERRLRCSRVARQFDRRQVEGSDAPVFEPLVIDIICRHA